MIIYKDAITGDEMFSDAFKMEETENGVVFEVDCAMVQHRKGVDVNTGANASTEEAAEELEDGVETVNNIVHSFKLQSTAFDKKSFMTYLKGYMKTTKTRLLSEGKTADEIKVEFESPAQAFAKKLLANFKDYEFYTGESMNPDGMIALLNFRDDGITPYFTYWKHGLKQEKV